MGVGLFLGGPGNCSKAEVHDRVLQEADSWPMSLAPTNGESVCFAEKNLWEVKNVSCLHMSVMTNCHVSKKRKCCVEEGDYPKITFVTVKSDC